MSLTSVRKLNALTRVRIRTNPRSNCRYFLTWGSSANEIKEQKYVLFKTLNAEPRLVYNVVSEVSKYDEFIPYCTESFVNLRNPVDGTPSEAGLRVGFKQYDEKFTCKILCQTEVDQDPNKFSVIADSISHNLFHILFCKWTVQPHPQRSHASKVELVLRFKFKSRLYNSVSAIFAKAVTELVMKAFDRKVFELKKAEQLTSRETYKSNSISHH